MTMNLQSHSIWFLPAIMAFLTAVTLCSCTKEEKVAQPLIHPVYYEKVFASEEQDGAIYVPSHAVNADYRGPYVYLIEPTEPGFGIARRQVVEISDFSSKGLRILQGIEEGDLIVTGGGSKIKDGDKVRLISEDSNLPISSYSNMLLWIAQAFLAILLDSGFHDDVST